MNAKDGATLERRKAETAEPLDPGYQPQTTGPVLGGASTRLEVSGRIKAVVCGGLASTHAMVRLIGLAAAAIDARLIAFKRHRPYFEPDHVRNLAYNILAGGQSIEDVEHLRNDPAYLDMLGAHRIPDPTTAGDSCRRLESEDTQALQEEINETGLKVWKRQRKTPKTRATLDLDGTTAPALGECKEGADFSYKGDYGYAPLIVSLAETAEALYTMRPELLLAVKRFLHNRCQVNGLGFSPFSAMLDVGSPGVGRPQVDQLPVVAQES